MREITKKDFSDDSSPMFPLKDFGEVWYSGWDIPGYWAIDATDQGFADFGAHGMCLRPCSIRSIIDELEENDGRITGARLRVQHGLKPALPTWVPMALTGGWTPPTSFNRDDYE